MKRVGIMLGIVFSFFIFQDIALAEEYYENENGVTLTEEEYETISQFYWEGYQEFMTEDDYDNFINENILDQGVETEYLNEMVPYSSSVGTNSKTLKISKSCSTGYCFISMTATWKTTPVTRSYDVIGARLVGVSRQNTPQTTVYTSNATDLSTQMVTASKGFGVSIKLPSSGINVIVNQTFKVGKGGTVYGSYQHAKNTVTLAQSKNYTISSTGYGAVFNFANSVASKYDGMQGVSMSV